MAHGLQWLLIGLVALIVGYLLFVIFGAWLSVKAAPKKTMFLCQHHGPIPMDATIDFLGTPYCPRCFHQRLRTAERGK